MVSINNPKKSIIQAIVILGIVLFYDTLIDVLLFLIHTIFELIHTIFEIIEQALDLMIEHLFNTDLHSTQIIVFYILLSIGSFVAFKAINVLSMWYKIWIEKAKYFWNETKLTLSYYSEKLVLLEKIRQWSIVMVLISLIMVFIFS
ncbi:hypothetical protein [Crenothrix polyspora]|uniref:Uncharacterized protein n=1 Tax=Crenothrix polyspora TaxID=360316 RepID=A0A1R4HFN1_9GAMM|nr:hypothetical protein [Crenothrix polyspora]SJM95044.1 conserved membrane hypothetical protein [Crenothrix polyspora]